MRTSWLLFLLCLGTACNESGAVISSVDDDGGSPSLSSGGVDCTNGPNFTGCPCKAGETRACYTGPAATRGMGSCKDGTQTCASQGGENPTFAFGACVGETLPSAADACTGDAGSMED